MPRWEPNPRERLERAALELFEEQGYDATTVEQIAAAAGLARSTFFRHFGDKREILFGGQDWLAARLADSTEHAPPEQPAWEAVQTALVDVGADFFGAERRDLAPRRIAVVAANPELRERELLKRVGITDAVTAALRSRGVDDAAATVVAQLAALAFTRTYVAWAGPDSTDDFAVLVRRELRRLRAATATVR